MTMNTAGSGAEPEKNNQPYQDGDGERLSGSQGPSESWSERFSFRSAGYQRELEANGKFLGADYSIYETTAPLEEIAAFEPDNGAEIIDEVIYVNGILTDTARHYGDAQELANSGARVYAFRNSSFGLLSDLVECALDKYPNANLLENNIVWPVDQYGELISVPAHALAEVIRERMVSGEQIHLVGHSQGAIIVARALRLIEAELKEQELSPSQVEQVFSDFKVETYGGAETNFVDGPQYVHVYNAYDPIPVAYGIGEGINPIAVPLNLGKDAVTYTFQRVNNPFSSELEISLSQKIRLLFDTSLHGPTLYFPERRSFAEMRAGIFGQNSEQ